MDTLKVVIDAAKDVVRDIDELYDGYRTELVGKLADVLYALQSNNSDAARRREITKIVEAFAGKVKYRRVDNS